MINLHTGRPTKLGLLLYPFRGYRGEPIGFEAQLACNAYSRPVVWAGDLDEKNRSGWPEFLMCDQGSLIASGSVSARSQVSCVQRLRLMPPRLSQNLIHTFWPLWPWQEALLLQRNRATRYVSWNIMAVFLTELLTRSSANEEEPCEHTVSWNRVNCCKNVRRIARENVCNRWMTFKVIQGHCRCHHLIGRRLFPISLLL